MGNAAAADRIGAALVLIRFSGSVGGTARAYSAHKSARRYARPRAAACSRGHRSHANLGAARRGAPQERGERSAGRQFDSARQRDFRYSRNTMTEPVCSICTGRQQRQRRTPLACTAGRPRLGAVGWYCSDHHQVLLPGGICAARSRAGHPRVRCIPVRGADTGRAAAKPAGFALVPQDALAETAEQTRPESSMSASKARRPDAIGRRLAQLTP